MRCPCGSGDTYPACCEPLHIGKIHAPTAVRLMQSRFSAFAVRQPGYLLDTWHSSTRPQRLELDDDQQWLLLEVVETTRGGLFDPTGVVEFRAHYRAAGTRGVMRERSNFIREDGRWRYLSGEQKQ